VKLYGDSSPPKIGRPASGPMGFSGVNGINVTRLMGRFAVGGTEKPGSVDSEVLAINIVFPALAGNFREARLTSSR